eukprot:2125791-Rhodomonas_salina.1
MESCTPTHVIHSHVEEGPREHRVQTQAAWARACGEADLCERHGLQGIPGKWWPPSSTPKGIHARVVLNAVCVGGYLVVRQPCCFEQIRPSHREPRVLALVVELERA